MHVALMALMIIIQYPAYQYNKAQLAISLVSPLFSQCGKCGNSEIEKNDVYVTHSFVNKTCKIALNIWARFKLDDIIGSYDLRYYVIKCNKMIKLHVL